MGPRLDLTALRRARRRKWRDLSPSSWTTSAFSETNWQGGTVAIDASPQALSLLREILQAHIPGCGVRAFGSRILGTARPFSDLDIVLVRTDPLPLERLAALREALSESNLPFLIDIVEWVRISPGFRAIINERYELLQRPSWSTKVGEGE